MIVKPAARVKEGPNADIWWTVGLVGYAKRKLG